MLTWVSQLMKCFLEHIAVIKQYVLWFISEDIVCAPTGIKVPKMQIGVTDFSKIASKIAFLKSHSLPPSLFPISSKHSLKTSLKMQLDLWFISNKEPHSKPHIYMVNTQIKHEDSLKPFYELGSSKATYALQRDKGNHPAPGTHLRPFLTWRNTLLCLGRPCSEFL